MLQNLKRLGFQSAIFTYTRIKLARLETCLAVHCHVYLGDFDICVCIVYCEQVSINNRKTSIMIQKVHFQICLDDLRFP